MVGVSADTLLPHYNGVFMVGHKGIGDYGLKAGDVVDVYQRSGS